jgi:hypothetical protein
MGIEIPYLFIFFGYIEPDLVCLIILLAYALIVSISVTWTRQSKERNVPDCQHKGHQRQDDCERRKYVVDPGRCLEPDDRRE